MTTGEMIKVLEQWPLRGFEFWFFHRISLQILVFTSFVLSDFVKKQNYCGKTTDTRKNT